MAVVSVIKEAVRALLPRERRAHRIRGGPLGGRMIYTSWHDYPGAIRGDTEAALLGWLGQTVRPGQTWLDVGAHYGYTALAMAGMVGAEGRVFAFEPVAETAACIARTKDLNQLNQLQIISAGLAAGPGERIDTMPLVRGMADRTAGASQRAVRLTGLLTFVPFDTIWPRVNEGRGHVDGVKIDVQGMEAQVLSGMTGMLMASHPLLVIEFHRGVDRREILGLLRQCGYSEITKPIEPGSGGLLDDKSYVFVPKRG